jgi:hypothetical protein|tara:strand:+ start:562 stop:834 length:273 start_codon:yes stop_codon:yes gene_type:complete
MNGVDYTGKQFFKHKETKQIVWLVIYQGPATTVADYETHECENYKNSDFKENFVSIKAPFPCQNGKAHNPEFESKWHCVQCFTIAQEESQ